MAIRGSTRVCGPIPAPLGFEGATLLAKASFGENDWAWLEAIKASPVHGIASKFWYRGKIQERLAIQAFPTGKPEGEFFYSSQRRLAAERATKVKWLLGQQIDEPLNRKGLAKRVGCRSHYLCRTFSAETGITISQYLRSVRIERAASLLRSGRYHVSEAAIEVGYQSSSTSVKRFSRRRGACLRAMFPPLELCSR